MARKELANEAAALRLLELFGASLEDALLPALLHSNAGVHRTWSCENAVSTPSAEREEPAADAAHRLRARPRSPQNSARKHPPQKISARSGLH